MFRRFVCAYFMRNISTRDTSLITHLVMWFFFEKFFASSKLGLNNCDWKFSNSCTDQACKLSIFKPTGWIPIEMSKIEQDCVTKLLGKKVLFSWLQSWEFYCKFHKNEDKMKHFNVCSCE